MSSDLFRARVAARLADLDVTGLAAELVRIPSHPGIPRQEEGVALALGAWLGARGVAAKLDPAAPGRPNLIARVSGAAAGRRLILCGHTDTVPLNADSPGFAFSGAVRDGVLQGRGAVDMKGAVAAMAAALVALDGVLPAGEVELAAVVDEEMESIGAESYVRAGLAADGAIVGEPTRNRIAVAHKGLEWLDVRFEGRAAHGGTPEKGINAIVAAARFVARVERDLQPQLAARAHPLLGPPTLNFGAIRGGDQPSTVAASCLLSADRRTVPGESYQDVIGEIETVLRAVEREMPGVRASVCRNAAGMATMEHLPLEIAIDHPLVAAALAARARRLGAVDAPVAFPAWTDGALLARPGGVPTLVLGPGELSLAHSPNEAVEVAELEAAARLYAEIALEFCSGPDA